MLTEKSSDDAMRIGIPALVGVHNLEQNDWVNFYFQV